MKHDFNRVSTHCFYCKRQYKLNKSVFAGKKYSPLIGTTDHILPKSQGGKNNPNNYISSCIDCNGLKSNRTPKEFAIFLIKQGSQKNHPMFPMFKYMIFNAWKLHNKKQKLFIK